MSVIACTKKWAEAGGFTLSPVPQVGYNPLFSWHANLFRLMRKDGVIVMNDATRYHLIFYGLKKAQYRDFYSLFIDSLFANLKAEQLPVPLIEAYLNRLGPVPVYTKTHNRSVLGSINDLIRMTEFRLEQHLPAVDGTMIELNKENNRTPVLKLKEMFPIDEMKKALREWNG